MLIYTPVDILDFQRLFPRKDLFCAVCYGVRDPDFRFFDQGDRIPTVEHAKKAIFSMEFSNRLNPDIDSVSLVEGVGDFVDSILRFFTLPNNKELQRNYFQFSTSNVLKSKDDSAIVQADPDLFDRYGLFNPNTVPDTDTMSVSEWRQYFRKGGGS